MKTNKSCLLISAVLTLLFFLPPTHTLAQETIIDRLDKKLDVKLPAEYEAKVKEFLDTCFWNVKSKDNNTIQDIKTRMQNFTEQFVLEQMKNDWDIDRQNQLLFIWDAIIDKIVGKEIYDGEDGNSKRLQECEKALDNLEACGEKYKEGIMPLVKEQIAENKRRIAEQNQRIAEQNQRIAEQNQQIAEQNQQIAEQNQQIAEKTKEIMRADSVGIKKMVNFYEKRSKLTQDEFIKLKDTFKWFIDECKVRGIDYKAILRKEVGDEKIVKDILKFYEIE